eukprot:TRINITY_DN16998_c1_g2_i2.p1 TRINITY_DN16998_c1_g2~~TRINITY_DN16998_c1_g2_i2.p1  ORF type:complete len:988 (-),score=251.96 TRINITY_DN16998_c1_g2_i2:74-3037(-)
MIPATGDSAPSSAGAAQAHSEIEALRRWLEVRPGDVTSLQRLGELQAERREGEEFAAFVRTLCRRDVSAVRPACRILHSRFGMPRAGAALLLEAFGDPPRDVQACVYLAALLPERAEAFRAQALHLDPSSRAAVVASADSHREAGRFGEAARAYKAAVVNGSLPLSVLCRLGEVLVQDGRAVEGREYLERVLREGGEALALNAAVILALSHVIDQAHEQALKYCELALGMRVAPLHRPQLKLARMLLGLTQLRSGGPRALDVAVRTLSEAADDGGEGVEGDQARQYRRWDVMIYSTLAVAEALRGTFAEADRCLARARAAAVASAGAEAAEAAAAAEVEPLLTSAAFVQQAQGNYEAAQSLAQRCLARVDDGHPVALLQIGYLMLRQGQLERAIQFLQKSVGRREPTLAYGAAQRGTAFLYLCVAHHWRASGGGAGSSSPSSSVIDNAAMGAFQQAFQLQPDLRRALAGSAQAAAGAAAAAAAAAPRGRVGNAAGGEAHQPRLPRLSGSGNGCFPGFFGSPAGPGGLSEVGQQLVQGSPPRLGLVDLTAKQASVLVLYANASGLSVGSGRSAAPAVQATVVASVAPPGAGGGHLGSPRNYAGKDVRAAEAAASPTLVGTASTSVPTLVGTTSTLIGTSSTVGEVEVSSAPAPVATAVPTASAPLPPGPGGSFEAPPAAAATTTAPAAAAAAEALAEARMRLPPAKVIRLADVQLGECLSRGELTTVSRGSLRDPASGRPTEVVVKTLHARGGDAKEQEAVAELCAEVATLAPLCHRNIVTFSGACLDPRNLALCTVWAPGGNLHNALHVRKWRPARHECFQLVGDLLDGVSYLHGLSPPIAHLDLKTLNLVLDASGQHVQICDFGLARAIAPAAGPAGAAASGKRGGTARYMAPECYDELLGAPTQKADVWSSACIILEVFSGCLPYAECRSMQHIMNLLVVQKTGPVLPSSLEPGVQRVVAGALKHEAAARPSIVEVQAQLRAVAR